MARYEITGPDGAKYEVNAPDGTPEHEVMAYFQRNFSGSEEDKAVPPGAIKNPEGGYAMGSLERPDDGVLGTLALSAGRGVDKLIAGGKQLGNWITGDDEAEQALTAQQNANDAAYAPIERNRPLTSAIGETLPGVAATLPVGGGAGLVGAAVRGGLAGAAPGLLSHGDAGERLERGAGGAVGGAIGGGLSYGLARGITPIKGQIRTPKSAREAAGRVGYRMSPSEITGNPGLANLEEYMARTPGSSGVMGEFRNANQAALNRSAAKAIGETGDDIGEETLKSASGRFSSEYDRLNQIAKPRVDTDEFLDVLSQIDSTNAKAGELGSKAVDKLVNKALKFAEKGELDGETYQAIRSSLGKKAQSTTDAAKKDALKRIQRALDDAADNSMEGADALARKATNRQYGDFKTLTKGLAAEGGDVSAKRVASGLAQRFGDDFATGRANSGLMDVARIGRGLPKGPNPNSGALKLSESLATSPISTMLAAGPNRIAANVYLSPVMQKYLSSAVLPPVLEGGLIRLGQAGGLLGAGTAQEFHR